VLENLAERCLMVVAKDVGGGKEGRSALAEKQTAFDFGYAEMRPDSGDGAAS